MFLIPCEFEKLSEKLMTENVLEQNIGICNCSLHAHTGREYLAEVSSFMAITINQNN